MRFLSSRPLTAAGLLILCLGAAGSCSLDRKGDLNVEPGTGGASSTSSGTSSSSSSSSSSSGTSASSSSATGTGGQGGGPPADCDSPADCQGLDSTCAQRTCVDHQCGWSYATAGTECNDSGGSVCDGLGLCVECVAPTDCPAGTCTNGVQTAGETCQGNTCVPVGNPINCDPYVCSGDQCLSNCGSISDCVSGHWCDGSKACVPTHPNGTPCGSGVECTSTHCTDGVCCNVVCSATCRSCVAAKNQGADGTCGPVPLWDDPDNECGPLGCSGGNGCASCGTEPAPPGGNCPSFCANNCANNTCVIDCLAKDECKADTITCPQGMACELNCLGDNACEDSIVHCPDDFACTVTCSAGHHSCDTMVLNCSTYGTCSMNCLGGDTCKNADINCGLNACSAACNGGDYPTLNNTSGACSSTSC